MTLSLDRQNQYRDRYRSERIGWQPATEAYEGLIRDMLRPGLRVLDIGCGRGGVFEQLGDAIEKPIGIDPDGASLVEHRIADLPRAVALADELPFRDACIDLIVCSWVLEHVEEPDRVFAELARCLRIGGKFIFLTPNAHAAVTVLNRVLRPMQSQLVRRLYGRSEVDTFPVVYRANTPATIRHLAEQHGMSVNVLHSIPDPTYLAFNAILYRASVLLSQVTPPVHLVGVLDRG